jgi:hypothetical protein
MLNWRKAVAVSIGTLAMVAGAAISAGVYLDPHADITKPFPVQVWQRILADYRAAQHSQVGLRDADSGDPAIPGTPNTPSKLSSYNAPLPSVGEGATANASPDPLPHGKPIGRTSRSLALLVHRHHLFDSRRRR